MFSAKLNRMAISKFRSGYFGGKMCMGGGLGALIFYYFKRALELSISVKMSPLAIF